MGEVFADDVAAGRAKDIADEEDIHWVILHRRGVLVRFGWMLIGVCVVAFCAWHRASGFS